MGLYSMIMHVCRSNIAAYVCLDVWSVCMCVCVCVCMCMCVYGCVCMLFVCGMRIRLYTEVIRKWVYIP